MCKCGFNELYTTLSMYVAASSSVCTAASCVSRYASKCASAAYKSASYEAYSSIYNTTTAPTLEAAAAGQICVSASVSCSAVPLLCSGITSGTYTSYGAYGAHDEDAASECNASMSARARLSLPGYFEPILCNTNACNAPSSASAIRVGVVLAAVIAAAAPLI